VSGLVVIQARMGSTRLPKKVLMDICGKPMLERLLDRVRDFRTIVATTDTEMDKPIRSLDYDTAIRVGSESDVLERFASALKGFSDHQFICRLTSDCCLIDPAMVSQAFKVLECSGVDLVGFQIQTENDALGFPDGFDVECFTSEALYKADAKAREAYEREHVTTWMKRHLDCITIRPGKRYPYYKLSVDTQEDLERVRKVYKAMLWHKPDFTVDDVGLYLRGLEDAK